jgi:prepilin-type N-terminal cleavage/methylation domain-containing protein
MNSDFEPGNAERTPLFSAGFTMVETMVVVAIIVITAALIAPSMIGLVQWTKLQGAVTALKNQLVTAKVRAIANPSVHCGVYFDMTSVPKKTIIFFDDNGNYVYDPGSDHMYLTTYDVEKTCQLQISGITNSCIVFRGDGSAKTGGKITLQTSRSTSTINVSAGSGRIKIQ